MPVEQHPAHQEIGHRLPSRSEAVSLCVLVARLGHSYATSLSRVGLRLATALLRGVLRVLLWRGWVDVMALAFLLGLSLYFFRDAFLTARIPYESDTAIFYYPLTSRFDQSLKEGVLPFWTRAIFAGYPLYADGETGVFYPINLVLFNLLPAWPAFLWRRVIAFVLGAWGMYALGRAMGFRPFGAAFAGIAFAYGSFLVAQMHHTNIVNSAIWLPFIFFAVEMALRSQGRRRFQWLALGGIALGVQSLAVHVQVVLMTLAALGFYLGYRALLGPVAIKLHRLSPDMPSTLLRRLLVANANVWLTALHRSTALVGALVLVVFVGLGIGAVQLLPLYQLAQSSARSPGVSYAFASTYALPVPGLLQPLFPYFFRNAAGEEWALWASWETALYLGIPTLVFALIGIFFARNRHTFFFLGLLLFSAALALGANAPANLHQLLWELPGFSYLRAPGRFSLLIVFAGAALAGWGAHWLDSRLSTKIAVAAGEGKVHSWRSGWFSLFLVFASLLPTALTLGVVTAHAWIEANREEVFRLLRAGQLVQPRDSAPGTLDLAYKGLRWSLDLANPSSSLIIGLLVATTALLVLWYGAPRLGYWVKGALLGLLAVDLLSFGAAYHPSISFADLATASPAAAFLKERAGEDRIFNKTRMRTMEGNRLVPVGVNVLNGYSSIPSQRHLEYLGILREGHDTLQDILVDVASVRYVVRDSKFTPLPSYNLVSFDPSWPLTQGASGNPGARVTFDGESGKGDTLGVVAALRHGVEIPDGTPVAEITVVTTAGERRSVPLQAGRHVSEWAFDRPDVRPFVRHARAEPAFAFENTDLDGRTYPVNLYYGALALGRTITAKRVELRYFYPIGSLGLYGLSLFDSKTGNFTQIRSKEKYRVAYRDGEALVYENTSPLPKAYVVARGVERLSSPQILWDMVEGDFDPRQMVILEDPAQAGFPREAPVSERSPGRGESRPFFAPAKLSTYSPTSATLTYKAPDTGYLVFTDSYYPGWEAFVDGSPTPIYLANYLFRAVRAPAGAHTVEFRFNPSILRLGLDTTLMSLGLAAAVILLPELWALIRLLARGLAH